MRGDRRCWGVLVALVFVLTGCDWSQAGFNAAHTEFNPIEPALTASSVRHLTQAWSADVNDSRLVVANGVIYTTKIFDNSSPNTASAFTVSTGARLWSTAVGNNTFPQAAANGLVYYGNGSDVVTLDAKTGAPRWTIAADFLALDGSRLFAVARTSSDNKLVAVDRSGNKVWSVLTSGLVTGAVVKGRHLVVLSFIVLSLNPPNGIILLSTYDESNGTLLRRVSVPARDAKGNVDFPSVPGDRVLAAGPRYVYFITGNGADLFAADPTTGAIAWHVAPPHGLGQFAVTPNAVIVPVFSGFPPTRLIAYSPTSGVQLWATTACDPLWPLVAGNLVFAGRCVYDRSTGALVTTSSAWSYVAVPSEGHVFVFGDHLQAMVPSP